MPLNAGEYEVTVGADSHHLVVTDIDDNAMSLEVDGLSQRYHYTQRPLRHFFSLLTLVQ